MKRLLNHQFPVGSKDLHPDEHLNMHLNYVIALGLIPLGDVKRGISGVVTVDDGRDFVLNLAKTALEEERTFDAAYYYRSAEFFTTPESRDKGENYERFRELFYPMDTDKVEEFSVPFEDYSLHTLRVLPEMAPVGTVVFFGGGDSVIEDFITIALYFAKHGYEVILFDGPGQGEAIYRNGRPFILDWERPVKVVLDYFDLDDVTLIGASFGGWLVLRAAAFEKRVKRVVAYDIIYDLFESLFARRGWLAKNMLRFLLRTGARGTVNRIVNRQMRENFWTEWLIKFSMYVNQVDSPYDYLRRCLDFNVRNHHPELVDQHVLLLAGEDDHAIPPEMLEKQRAVLVNAESVTTRLFTREEHAATHCQAGNIGLALDVMIRWIETKSTDV